MDVRNSLTSLKQDIMAKIQLAASQQHTQAIIQLSTFAKQVDADLETLSEIEEHITPGSPKFGGKSQIALSFGDERDIQHHYGARR
jgi:hypothetical protein